MEKLTYREITNAIVQLSARVDQIDQFLGGIVAILGKDEILAAAKDAAESAAAEVEGMLKRQVEGGVEAGWLKPIKVSGLDSVVVGYETLAGQPAHRMQVIPKGLAPKDRGNYIGRSIGEEFTLQTPVGVVTTKITEVYEVDEDRRKEVIAEAQKAKAVPPPEAAPEPAPAEPTEDTLGNEGGNLL